MDMSDLPKLEAVTRPVRLGALSGGERREYVTAWLDDAEYAFDCTRIQQIRPFSGAQACSGSFVVGEFDAGGRMAPIIDLRVKLGRCDHEYRGAMLVLVALTRNGIVGILVDSMSALEAFEFAVQHVLRRADGITVIRASTANTVDKAAPERLLRIVDVDHLLETASLECN